MQKLLVTGCVLTVLAGCSNPRPAVTAEPASPLAARAAAPGVPTYRFVTGKHRSTLGSQAFLGELATCWLPAMARLQGSAGMVAYFSALPLAGDSRLPDEVGLAAYESEAAAERAERSPEVVALAEALYDAPGTLRKHVLPLTPELGAGSAFDALQQPTDWQGGFTTFFIGARHAELPPAEFLRRLGGQVQRERQAFLGQGLRAYVFMATPDHKLSYMHWADMAAFGRAMESLEGKAVIAESQALMRTVQFASAREFRGTLAPGQIVMLKLEGDAGSPRR